MICHAVKAPRDDGRYRNDRILRHLKIRKFRLPGVVDRELDALEERAVRADPCVLPPDVVIVVILGQDSGRREVTHVRIVDADDGKVACRVSCRARRLALNVCIAGAKDVAPARDRRLLMDRGEVHPLGHVLRPLGRGRLRVEIEHFQLKSQIRHILERRVCLVPGIFVVRFFLLVQAAEKRENPRRVVTRVKDFAR